MKFTALILISFLSVGGISASETSAEAERAALESKLEYISIELLDRYGIYIIKQGDTIAKVAKQFGTSVGNLLEWNPHITDPTKIKLVLVIRIRECGILPTLSDT